MSLTRPIPEEAMLIVEILRKDVKKPKYLPKFLRKNYGERPCLCWTGKCPMGLHPKAKHQRPYYWSEFPFETLHGWTIQVFADWWDAQYDPIAAVNAVWPEEQC